MANLTEILESSLFLWGLALGVASLIVVLMIAGGRQVRPPLPIGGLLISVASVVAFGLGGEFSGISWLAIGVVLVLTLGTEILGASPRLTAAASVPGAVVMSLAAPSAPDWFRLIVFASIPVGGYLIDRFENRYRDLGLGVIFFSLAVAGVFLAVPDTELARAMVAVALPVVFLAWPRVRISLGRTGAYMAMAVLSLTATAGAIGRPASIVGAMASLGFLVLEPVAVRLRPKLARLPDSLHRGPEAAFLATFPQAILVFVTSRVAGPLSDFSGAIVVVVLAFGTSYLLLRWVESARIPTSPGEDLGL